MYPISLAFSYMAEKKSWQIGKNLGGTKYSLRPVENFIAFTSIRVPQFLSKNIYFITGILLFV